MPVQVALAGEDRVGRGRASGADLYRQYFGLVAAGARTIEVRVKYRHLVGLGAGDLISFRVKGTDETCEVKALPDGEGPANGNPNATRAEQLAGIRAIYPPEKEALSQ
ncbi:RNA-binding protein [Streptomyces sp. NPDC020299]|uniref:RNA-binding protein n=1 Tax=Streptomyces sp. NPDC020299 TaxID=3365067 RepID=UPI00379D385C